ncbi:hypothetical protein FACS189435_3980 [Bacteroidia bacterium]|nr:hypothetical protein FACS189435_3980 [Bacteroidia bacterium]
MHCVSTCVCHSKSGRNGLALSQHKDLDYAKAAASYREALQVLEKLAEKKAAYRPDVGRTLCSLGNVYDENGEYVNAEAAFTKSLQVYRNLAAKDRLAYLPHVASALYALGCSRYNNNDGKAEAAFMEAITIWKRLAEIDPMAYRPQAAMALNKLGGLYKNISNDSQAEACIQEALQILRDLAVINPDGYKRDIADTLFSLAGLQKQREDYRLAEESYKEALLIRKELSRKDRKHLHSVVASLISLSTLYKDSIPVKGMSLLYSVEAVEVLRRCPNTLETQRLSDEVRMIRIEWKKRESIDNGQLTINNWQ